jgi:hypothetical protein
MRTDDDGRMYDHGYRNQRLAGVLRSWPSEVDAGQETRDHSELILEALDSVELEDGCFALSDIDTALKVNEWRQIIEHSRIPVMAWCVRSTYDPEGKFSPGNTVVWAAFMTKAQAEQWLPYWKKRFARRIETGDIYEVVKCPALLSKMLTESADPDDEDWNPK